MKKIAILTVAASLFTLVAVTQAQSTPKVTIKPMYTDVYNFLSATAWGAEIDHGIQFSGSWGGGNGYYQNVITYDDGSYESDNVTTTTSQNWYKEFNNPGPHWATLVTNSIGIKDSATSNEATN